MNGKQRYDSYGTHRLEMCWRENFWRIFLLYYIWTRQQKQWSSLGWHASL